MAYSSAAFHWFALRSGQPDPSGLPSRAIFAVKIVGGLIFVTALVLTVTANDVGRRPPDGPHPSRTSG
jgi:hypothetical protein